MPARSLTNRDEILDFLAHDRLYAAYAIGDLEPPLFSECEWLGAEEGGRLHAVVLLYKGLEPPALFLMGKVPGLATVLRFGFRERRVYVTCREEHVLAVKAFYATEPPAPMWRMVMQPRDFRPVNTAAVMPLSPRHVEELEILYAQGGGDAFTPFQLATGVFYGVRIRGRMVAAAGTHLISPTFGLGAIGNVYTEKAYRGRGYATAATSAVVRELFRRGIRCVVLNVAQSNATAIRIYQRLGFNKHCPYVEMLAVRRG
jgi:GNAT superfamily N-acetyltransferase